MNYKKRMSLFGLSIFVIVLVSFVSNMAYNDWGLPGLWHPDEVTKISAKLYYDNTLNPHFFAYPSLQIYLIYLLVILPYSLINTSFANTIASIDPTNVSAALLYISSEVTLYARMITALMGALCVYFTYRSAELIYGRVPALIAAFLLATSAGFVGLSHFASVDIPLTFWMVFCFFFIISAFKSDEAKNYYLAAILLGLATSTKYTGILLLPTLLLSYLIDSGHVTVRFSNLRYKIFGKTIIGIGAAVALGFFIGTPFAVLSPLEFLREFIKLLFYQPAYGGLGQKSYIPHLYNLINYFGLFNFLICSFGFFWGCVTLLRKKQAGEFFLILTIVIYYIKMGDMTFHPPRYIIPILPFLTILGGKLCFDLLHLTSRSKLLNWGWITAFALGGIFSLYYTTMGVMSLANDDRKLAYEWVNSNMSPNDSVEVSAHYSINIPPGFNGFSKLPYYHIKPTFIRMRENELYRRLREVYIKLDRPGAVEGKSVTEEVVVEPTTASLRSLLIRKPRYIILSKSDYQRFLGGDEAEHLFPLQHELYSSIIAGMTPYELLVDFERTDRWPRPNIEFVNAGIKIYEYRHEP